MAGLGNATSGSISREFEPTSYAGDPPGYMAKDAHGWRDGKLYAPVPGGQHYGHVHLGRDVANAEGTPILAVERGIVLAEQYTAERGYLLLLGIHRNAGGHIDTVVEYQHLEATGRAAVGSHVARGAHIARMGHTGQATGPHLHWAVAHAIIAVPYWWQWQAWFQYNPHRLQVGGDLAGSPWIVPNT